MGREDGGMRQRIKEHLVDGSDREICRFSITCEECGSVWKSTAKRFSRRQEDHHSESSRIIAQALYQRERTQNMDHALWEAAHHFNSCPLCGRLVCNYCFVICDDLDMCRDCASRLHETGESVLERA